MTRRAPLLLTALALAAAAPPPASRLPGFSPASAARQLEVEAGLAAALSAERIEGHLRELTSRAHPAGSEGARLTAEYIRGELAGYGLDGRIERYDAYLPLPRAVSVELTEPLREEVPVVEEAIAEDPFTHQPERFPAWAGYSASGEAEGQVVYAHFGSERDLGTLGEMGVDLRGKVLLVRHFGTGTGRKVRNAEQAGAAGVVLYADPAEDGFPYGDVYPRGNWRPAGSIMRRSVIHLPYEGDPLSPGWASLPGAPRLDPGEVPLPRIPVQPISYRSAERILGLLAGPVAPAGWQGALPVTYRIGPGPARLRVRTEMDFRDRPMWNVVARLEGAVEPDQWVLLGNHHDAWIYGAGDPSSGTAVLLELARVLSDLAARGVRPRRTLVLAFWDAEEMLLGGSTEWVEHHQEELLDHAVAYVNMDAAVFNPQRALSVAAHPALHELFRGVAGDVPDPRTGRSTFEVWRDLQNRFRRVPGVDGWGEFFDPEAELDRPKVFEVPYDDAAPFYNLLALPASDMYYGADYGMYHSLYENFHWMSRVVDPGFAYHLVMAQIHGRVGLRLANAELPPLDFVEESRFWRLAYEDLAQVAEARGQAVPRLAEALTAIDAWSEEAAALAADTAALLASGAADGERVTAIGRAIARAPRDFRRPEGRPDMPFDRNLFSGWSFETGEVSGGTLPGIRFALDRRDPATATAEADLYLGALERRLATLRSIRTRIAEAQASSPPAPGPGSPPPDRPPAR